MRNLFMFMQEMSRSRNGKLNSDWISSKNMPSVKVSINGKCYVFTEVSITSCLNGTPQKTN